MQAPESPMRHLALPGNWLRRWPKSAELRPRSCNGGLGHSGHARRSRWERAGVQVHALRLPSYILSCEALFGLPDERLTIRHDAGSSAAPYVAGTLLAIRRVGGIKGLVRGLDALIE